MSTNISATGSTYIEVVKMIIPHSPAATAGIQLGDAILSVDGIKMIKMTLETIINQHCRGVLGITVKITIEHPIASVTVIAPEESSSSTSRTSTALMLPIMKISMVS